MGSGTMFRDAKSRLRTVASLPLAAARTRVPLVILGGAIFIAIGLIMGRPQDPPTPRGERAWLVDILPVNYGSIEPMLELFGSVQSPQDANLSAGIEATVNAVLVRDGETVKAGQVLVVLDDRDASLTLRQRRADILEIEALSSFSKRQLATNRVAFEQEKDLLEIAESRFERAEELFALGRLSRSDYENATENLKRQSLSVSRSELAMDESAIRLDERQAQLDRAYALSSQAELDVERATISAPFRGVISDLRVSEGDRVRVGDSLMRLQNPDSIEVRTQIPANYISAINAGIAADIEMSAVVDLNQTRITGRLTRISGQTREGSGGVDSYIGFSKPPIGLRLGSTVRILLKLPPQDNVVSVPAEAIYGRDRLYKIIDGRMQQVQVERVGERINADGTADIIVRSPKLTASDSIIATKLANATDGLLVRVQTPRAKQEVSLTRPVLNQSN